MAEPLEVTLCMGSSCFARGNNLLLADLEDVIARNAWRDRVRLAGCRCLNLCGGGPNLKIDGRLRQNLDFAAVEELLAGLLAAPGAAGPERTR
jgi:NADH:ubiquinone oxidoreductase subunit E